MKLKQSHQEMPIKFRHLAKFHASIKSQTPIQHRSKRITEYNIAITSHARRGRIREAESLFLSMPLKNAVSHTAMLTAYADNGEIHNARQLFDQSSHRSTASWNAMITAYTSNPETINEAYSLFLEMTSRNAVSYAAMISGFIRCGHVHKAESLYGKMPHQWRHPFSSNAPMSGYLKAGRMEDAVAIFNTIMDKNVVTWSCMLDGYCKEGLIKEARQLFDEIPDRIIVTWTAMIKGYMTSQSFNEGFSLFRQMTRDGNVKVNAVALTVMLDACGNAGERAKGVQIHALVILTGFNFDVFLSNSVITMYSKFGLINEAITAFQLIENKDTVSWNAVISAYVENNQFENALKAFDKMPNKDGVSMTTMMAGYAAQGNVEKSIEIFNTMPKNDSVSWTVIISSFVNRDEPEEAFGWFCLMLRNDVRPNAVTFTSVLCGSACMANLPLGSQIHSLVTKTRFEKDLSVQNSLITMYSKGGDLCSAETVFRSLGKPNDVSFNEMATAFSHNGDGLGAIRVFEEMVKEGVRPNWVTFLVVLSACAHMGLVEQGLRYFNEMKCGYDVDATCDHYACVVDLLGRAGLIDEALGLIRGMPCEPNGGVWGALLSGCRTHDRFDVAEVAGKRITELQPRNTVPYVVLCEVYCLAGRKELGEEMMMVTKEAGLRKEPGSSWIHVGDELRVFLSGYRNLEIVGVIESLQSLYVNSHLNMFLIS